MKWHHFQEERIKDCGGRNHILLRFYRDFLDGRMSLPRASAVVADFAVLNSIRDLTPLFHRFSQILESPGRSGFE
jgi:hypothetical protein